MPSSGSTPVLLANESGYSVLAAVRALRAAGYAPWLAVSEPGTYAARSRAKAGTVSAPNPSLDSEGFVRELAAAATRLSAVAVLPTEEHHLSILADREADFAGIPLGVPSGKSVERATDKALLSELAGVAGLLTPPTRRVVHGERDTAVSFGFPAIIKPLRSRIWSADGTIWHYHAHHVREERQVREALDSLPYGEGLVQPYIHGTLFSISGVSWEGELICALHQTVIRQWPVPVGGSSYAETATRNTELERGVSSLLRALGWSGLFQAQFIRDPDGEYYLIDLNPRIYGSLALATAAGLNLPAIWVDLLLGKRPKVNNYRVGVRYRHEAKDLRALAWSLLTDDNRHRRRMPQGLLPRPRTVHAVMSVRDPAPLLTTLLRGGTYVTSAIRERLPMLARLAKSTRWHGR